MLMTNGKVTVMSAKTAVCILRRRIKTKWFALIVVGVTILGVLKKTLILRTADTDTSVLIATHISRILRRRKGEKRMTNEQKLKAMHIVYVYGSKAQMLKCCEELSELEAAILKHINKEGKNTDEVLDEMADVYIMLEQMKSIFPFGENVLNDRINYKLNRQMDRINGKQL